MAKKRRPKHKESASKKRRTRERALERAGFLPMHQPDGWASVLGRLRIPHHVVNGFSYSVASRLANSVDWNIGYYQDGNGRAIWVPEWVAWVTKNQRPENEQLVEAMGVAATDIEHRRALESTARIGGWKAINAAVGTPEPTAEQLRAMAKSLRFGSLYGVTTGRTQSARPNLQNYPRRDAQLTKDLQDSFMKELVKPSKLLGATGINDRADALAYALDSGIKPLVPK